LRWAFLPKWGIWISPLRRDAEKRIGEMNPPIRWDITFLLQSHTVAHSLKLFTVGEKDENLFLPEKSAHSPDFSGYVKRPYFLKIEYAITAKTMSMSSSSLSKNRRSKTTINRISPASTLSGRKEFRVFLRVPLIPLIPDKIDFFSGSGGGGGVGGGDGADGALTGPGDGLRR